MHSAYELFVGNVARIIYAVSMHHPNHTIYNPLIQGVTALRAIPLRENTWRYSWLTEPRHAKGGNQRVYFAAAQFPPSVCWGDKLG